MVTSLGEGKLNSSCRPGEGWDPSGYSCPRHATGQVRILLKINEFIQVQSLLLSERIKISLNQNTNYNLHMISLTSK